MKKILFVLTAILAFNSATAQSEMDQFKNLLRIDSIIKTFKYDSGIIEIKTAGAALVVPAGYKFLNSEHATILIEDLFGNPPGDRPLAGALIPDNTSLFDANSFIYTIDYNEMGYVKDDDAEDINYEDLMKDMKKSSEEDDKKRDQLHLQKLKLIGWAASPFYDKKTRCCIGPLNFQQMILLPIL